jgi:hypothetical protein
MCFKCHHLVIPADRCTLFVHQMDALKLGLVSCVDQMREIYWETMGCSDMTVEERRILKDGFDNTSSHELHTHLKTCLLAASGGK